MKIGRLGVIAGNGPLPFLVAEEAVRQKLPVTLAAIKEEVDPSIEPELRALGGDVNVRWMGVGQLGKLLTGFREDKVDHAVLVGQVKHVRIFARGSKSPFSQLKHLPDLKMLKMLASLPMKNTGSLLEAVIEEVEKAGVKIIDSTHFLERLLAGEGVMTRRKPNRDEEHDFEYGRMVAREITRLDLGQTIVVKDQAVVAVEAMEGTDATIRRAGELAQGEPLTVIKASRPSQDLRYDVPVVGLRTMETFRACNVTALAVDAGKTLMIDREDFLKQANEIGMTIVGF